MNRKISLGLAISLIAIACAITFVITMTVSLNNYNSKIADVQQRGEIYTKLQETDSFVRNYSLYEIDDSGMKAGVYSGYLSCISDSHAKYYNTDEYYYKTQIESGRLVGFGMNVEKEEGGYIRVADVYKHSPAYDAGILPEDIIISINGTSVLELGYDNAVNQLKYGDEGTKLRFTMGRNGEEMEYNLTRASFDIESVTAEQLDNGILYIDFTAIDETTSVKLRELFADYEPTSITGYIFDLRACSSGVYSSVSGILKRFVGDAKIASAQYRNNSTKTLAETDGGDFTNLPISIIIDEKTGGSAELIAEALHDINGAATVGENTMGYGTIQETKTFGDGTAIEISVAYVVPATESGSYEGIGLTPEYVVEYSGEYENSPKNYALSEDAQLKKAVEVIISKIAVSDESTASDEIINN